MDRKSTSLFEVVAKGDETTLQRLLLEAKEERNIATLAHGNTVLHEAAWNGFSRCVKILCNVYPKDLDENCNKEKLSWKKNHFINRVNFCGFSALHLAAQNGHNQTLRELLYAGCSTSIHNDYGDTPLHTACRYGHAGVVRILISAKCDVDAFNLNHDTPLHITCAMGRRKLTKLLLEADAMNFQNLQHETPLDIAQRKNLKEIVDIMKNHKAKADFKLIRESTRSNKSPSSAQPHLLPHNSNQKYKHQSQTSPRHWSPYGCHYYPDTRNFPTPKIELLPKDPLEKGEQYYLDLAGNIRKGPVGKGNKCNCVFDNEASTETCRIAQKHVEEMNEKLDMKINALAMKIQKTVNKQRSSGRSKSKERNLDPLYPLLRIVGDKNKQLHLEKWLYKVYPDIGSNSDLQNNRRSGENVKEVAVDVHCESAQKNEQVRTKVSRNSSKLMPRFDENGNNEIDHVASNDDDENYTDVSNESEESGNGSIVSNNENFLYDEGFIRKFQHQQFVHQGTHRNDSLTSQSASSNQNIEMEMEKITKSLMLDNESLMVNRNPDVIKDHIQHSAKRSTKKIKSAITKPTAILASGDLYVNSYFNNDSGLKQDDEDETDSIEIEDLISKVHQSIINSSNVSTVSSSTKNDKINVVKTSNNNQMWSRTSRSRNPLPLNIDEIEKCSEKMFESNETLQDEDLTTILNDNNFVLLDQLLKARKKFNQTYQHQLEMMHQLETHPTAQRNPSKDVYTSNVDSTIPSSSTLV